MSEPRDEPVRRRPLSALLTAGAVVVVWAALVLPDGPGALEPVALLRVPLEGLALAAILLLLPGRFARPVALAAGVVLAVLTLVKVLDLAVGAVLHRAFDPVSDPGLFGSAVGVVADSIGGGWAILVAVLVVVLGLAGLVAVVAAVRRLPVPLSAHRSTSGFALAGLGVVWGVCALVGAQLTPGVPLAAADEAGVAVAAVGRTVAAVGAERSFDAQLRGVDAFASVPAGLQLAKLRGKDVLVVFVESYGQVAVQGSWFSPAVGATLAADTRTLASAGFSARSAQLTSPTFGGISWLAHSTLQSGVWVPNQQFYDRLLAGRRLTLTGAFHRAGWRTVSDIPSDRHPWPQGRDFYHYDRMYDATDVGYAGPAFSYASMPDQFTLARFGQLELGAGHPPVMAEIDLVSSHTPWTPLPHLVAPAAVGDGSVFDPMPAEGTPPRIAWQHPHDVQALYGQSIRYSIDALTRFITGSHDKNLVVIMLGDHQPAEVVSGADATHDVPVSVIAADPSVLGAIDGWHWTAGLRPDPAGPIWRMDGFRNRFFDAFRG